MNYNEYKEVVINSEIGSLTTYPKSIHALMGMNGEAGECIDILKKHYFQGHKLDEKHLLNELGDVCWYTMLLMVDLNIEPSVIFDYIDRLIHPEDKYSLAETCIGQVFNLNTNCGKAIDICFDNSNNPGMSIYGVLRLIFYNIKVIANEFNKTLEDIFDINYRKIRRRYPNGFSTEMSINRGDSL